MAKDRLKSDFEGVASGNLTGLSFTGGRDAQYCPLWPCDGVSGLGQNARTTGGAGILPAAILRDARLKRLKWTALGETPTLLDFGEMADLREGFEIVVLG